MNLIYFMIIFSAACESPFNHARTHAAAVAMAVTVAVAVVLPHSLCGSQSLIVDVGRSLSCRCGCCAIRFLLFVCSGRYASHVRAANHLAAPGGYRFFLALHGLQLRPNCARACWHARLEKRLTERSRGLYVPDARV